MKVGSLVRHKKYLGVGIVVAMRKSKHYKGTKEWKVYWFKEGKVIGWANANHDLQQGGVEVISESR